MNLFQKLKDGANKASDYAQQTLKTTKLNSLISGLKKEIERNNLQIGQAVYDAYKANDLTLAEEIIRKFSNENLAIEIEIADLEREIEVIKNEKMCECGRKAATDVKFCSSCGKRFPIEPEPEVVEVEIKEEQVYTECSQCGADLAPDAKFCEKCGAVVRIEGS